MKLLKGHMDIIRKLEREYGQLEFVPDDNPLIQYLHSCHSDKVTRGRKLPIDGVKTDELKRVIYRSGLSRNHIVSYLNLGRTAYFNRIEKKNPFLDSELIDLAKLLQVDVRQLVDDGTYKMIEEKWKEEQGEGKEDVDVLYAH